MRGPCLHGCQPRGKHRRHQQRHHEESAPVLAGIERDVDRGHAEVNHRATATDREHRGNAREEHHQHVPPEALVEGEEDRQAEHAERGSGVRMPMESSDSIVDGTPLRIPQPLVEVRSHDHEDQCDRAPDRKPPPNSRSIDDQHRSRHQHGCRQLHHRGVVIAQLMHVKTPQQRRIRQPQQRDRQQQQRGHAVLLPREQPRHHAQPQQRQRAIARLHRQHICREHPAVIHHQEQHARNQQRQLRPRQRRVIC